MESKGQWHDYKVVIQRKKEPEIFKDGVKLVSKQDYFYVPIKVDPNGNLIADVSSKKKNGVELAIERLDKNTHGMYDSISMLKDNTCN